MQGDSYKKFAAAFGTYFDSLKKNFPKEPANLYEPLQYFLSLDGKRVRPLLALIASDCFGDYTEKALPVAAAIELFHNFSLIHDDIMDKAPLRRGQPTVHAKWSMPVAILSGDVLLVKAYQQLSLCERHKELEELFSRTSVQVCEGQQYDMDFESRADVSIGEYLEMIRLKTAVLLGCSLKLGALCADASDKSAAMFYTAGVNLGMAFQLTDDYLDVFGESEKVGKQSGGDILSNKKTWLLLKAFESVTAEQKKELHFWLDKKEFDAAEKIQAVKQIFSDLRIGALLTGEIEHYYQRAFADLHAACPNEKKVNEFISFIKTLMRREK
jgi:geranylgeranyl diphosphate synthase type II